MNSFDPYKLDPNELHNILPPLSASDLASKGNVEKTQKFNCRIFDIQNLEEREEFESLMTEIYSPNSKLTLNREQNTFSKDGDYFVVLRWFSEED